METNLNFRSTKTTSHDKTHQNLIDKDGLPTNTETIVQEVKLCLKQRYNSFQISDNSPPTNGKIRISQVWVWQQLRRLSAGSEAFTAFMRFYASVEGIKGIDII